MNTSPNCTESVALRMVVNGMAISFVPGDKAISNSGRAEKSPWRFRLRSSADVIHASNMTWAVHSLFPLKGVIAVYGASGSGKSLLAVQLAAMLALGQPWFGRLVPTKLRVVFVALEGQGGMPLRLRAWAKAYQQDFPDGVKFVFESLAINQEDEVRLFAAWIEQMGGTDVIIVDTLNRASPGADENRSADMGKMFGGASLLHVLTDTLVILIHHSGKDESRGLRGHSSLLGALDAVIEVKRDSNNKRWWRLEKAKDGEDGSSQSFELELADLGNDDYGLPMTSVAVRELEGPGPSTQKQAALGKNQMAVLVQFKILITGLLLANPADAGAPVGIVYDDCVQQLKDCVDVSDARHRTARVKEALNSLIKLGHIVDSGGLLTLPD